MKTNQEQWTATGAHCRMCRAPLELSQVYDAVACRRCDRWEEPACGDPACWARCATRPARPSAAAELARLPPTENPTHFFSRMLLRLREPTGPAEPGPSKGPSPPGRGRKTRR